MMQAKVSVAWLTQLREHSYVMLEKFCNAPRFSACALNIKLKINQRKYAFIKCVIRCGENIIKKLSPAYIYMYIQNTL